ncbi:MAG: hypothetical protein JWO56_1812, partial [Acidobacteria bacterium]|nr:hypothetical protein [Acidobacteriota bacterium]
MLVDWSQLQPVPGAQPGFANPSGGCMRGVGPCSGWAGLSATLHAVGALGAQPVLVVYGTPDWAATKVPGCEAAGTTSYARMPNLAAYRGFVAALLALGRREGIALPWWSAWNEPNLSGFLNPQRQSCSPTAPAVAAGLYARLAGALAEELQ